MIAEKASELWVERDKLRVDAFQREQTFDRKDSAKRIQGRCPEVLIVHDVATPTPMEVVHSIPEGHGRVLKLVEVALNERLAALSDLGLALAPIGSDDSADRPDARAD